MIGAASTAVYTTLSSMPYCAHVISLNVGTQQARPIPKKQWAHAPQFRSGTRLVREYVPNKREGTAKPLSCHKNEDQYGRGCVEKQSLA